MVWTYRGRAVPLEVYHGVPRGWRANEIVAEHARLGGTFDLTGPEATEPGAPAWLPERYSWLQYRQMLHRVGEVSFKATRPASKSLFVTSSCATSGRIRVSYDKCLRGG